MPLQGKTGSESDNGGHEAGQGTGGGFQQSDEAEGRDAVERGARNGAGARSGGGDDGEGKNGELSWRGPPG